MTATSQPDRKMAEELSDEEVRAAAEGDPDALPLPPERLARMRRVTSLPDLRAIRERLGLSQEQFARTFRLPVATVRDWEQSRRIPDAPSRALLTVIAREPDAARRALAAETTDPAVI